MNYDLKIVVIIIECIITYVVIFIYDMTLYACSYIEQTIFVKLADD